MRRHTPSHEKDRSYNSRRQSYPCFSSANQLDLGGFTYHSVKGRGARPRQMVRTSGSGRLESPYNLNTNFFVVVRDDVVDKVIETIVSHAGTGLAGEGKVFVSSVMDTVDIGSKERGEFSL